MQRRFTEGLINANVEWCFVIGQYHGNGALYDVGVGTTCASNVVHKVPNVPCPRVRSTEDVVLRRLVAASCL